jgi:hypothetical protein
MKLDAFLAGGGAQHAATRTFKIRVVGKDPQENNVVGETEVDIAFVPERYRQEALRDAAKALHEAFGDTPVPEESADSERKYHILLRALRDSDNPKEPWCGNVTKLKNALVIREANRAWDEYCLFLEEEFPNQIDNETFANLVEQAKKVSLPDLIDSFGFDVVRRSIFGFLAVHMMSHPQTSTASRPAN